jgi:hypothetical protein
VECLAVALMMMIASGDGGVEGVYVYILQRARDRIGMEYTHIIY